MGRAKQQQIEDDHNGFYSGRELRVCINHFQDKDILKYFEKGHSLDYDCDFCDEPDYENETEGIMKFRTISWDQLMNRIVPYIMKFYDDPANGLSYESAEGGYIGAHYDSLELLSEVIKIEADFDVIEEIANTLTNEAWTKAEFYGPTYLDHLEGTWEAFSKLVKHKVRYLFYEFKDADKYLSDIDRPFFILQEIGKFIKELELFASFPENKNIFEQYTSLYRATQYNPELRVVKDCSGIGSAPIEHAGANRFSPEGISIFYGAADEETAIKEIQDLKNTEEVISVGVFKVARKLNLIDLRNIPNIGVFNTEMVDQIEPSRFLKLFVESISKKIEGDQNHRIEYIPSQIVTEYLRYVLPQNFDKAIDGIVYNSVQNPNNFCYAIFANDEMCCDQGRESEKSLLILEKNSIVTRKVTDIKNLQII